MEYESSPPPGAPRTYVFVLLAAYLILIFCYRAFLPGHEYMHGAEWWIAAVLDIVLTVALAASIGRLPFALYAAGLAAGIGLWIIRLHGHDSWASGHWDYWLTPR